MAILTLKEAALKHKLSVKRLYTLVNTGILPYLKNLGEKPKFIDEGDLIKIIYQRNIREGNNGRL